MSGSGRVYLEPSTTTAIDQMVQTGEKVGRTISAHVSMPGSTDAFNRIQVSNPRTLFDSKQIYPEGRNVWLNKLTSGGAVVHLPNEAASQLSVGTTAGAMVIRQTSEYIQYQPGKAQNVLITGVMGNIKAGVRQRIGTFDAENGLFYEQDGTNLQVVRRSKASGVVVDTTITQTSWEPNPLDGTDVSGITLDMSKTQIFVFNFQWLGVGSANYGFQVGGKPVPAHSFKNANNLDEVYMGRGSLPLRFELENLTTTASTTTMKHICCSVFSDGGFERTGFPHSASNQVTGIAVSATGFTPILGIRVASSFNGITNRMKTAITETDIFATGSDCFWRWRYDGADTGGSWLSVDASNSGMELNVTAVGLTGGLSTNHVGYIQAANNRSTLFQDENVGSNKYPLTLDIDGTNPSSLFIEARTINGNGIMYVSFGWDEIY